MTSVLTNHKNNRMKPQPKFALTSDYVLYFEGKAEILKNGDVFTLAGFRLSTHGDKSPFHYKDDIIRLPNGILEPLTN